MIDLLLFVLSFCHSNLQIADVTDVNAVSAKKEVHYHYLIHEYKYNLLL